MKLAADPLRALSAPLESLLASGGDSRLNLDPVTQLNGYGCRPFPRPEAFTFASSTATSISDRAFAAAAGARQSLLREARKLGFERAYDEQIEALRAALKDLLGLDRSGCEIVFSPSGTDSQLHAVVLARALLGGPLVSLVAAADETGSGAAYATSGCHFNATTARGIVAGKGEPIRGLADGVASLAIGLRDDAGQLRSNDAVDDEIARAVARAVGEGKRVLLFAMDSSKFGQRSPSLDCLRSIAGAARGAIQIVIDACQARLGRKRLRWYLDQGFMVLLTGSKFFTGAPFSGALFVPANLAARCAALEGIADGLGAYTGRSDWPHRLAGIRAALSAHANLGAWLRWTSALEEMRAYFAVPDSFRFFALARFAETLPRLIAAETCLEPVALAPTAAPCDDLDNEEFAARTIFPFFLLRQGRALSQLQATAIYRALNDDVAALLPATLPPTLRPLAARPCHIGQPVALPGRAAGAAGALRISAGARFVSESWHPDTLRARTSLRSEFDQVRAIIEKIALLVRYFDAIAPVYAPGAVSEACQETAA